MDKTLREIFENQEIYIGENKSGWEKYSHNLNVIQSNEIKENEEFQKILNKTFRELYEDYINSDEFLINEINRLKETEEDNYVERYVYLAKNFVDIFCI